MSKDQSGKPLFLKEVFNFGIKANDVDAEVEFFDAFNPQRKFVVDRSKATYGPKEVPAVEVGGTKFFFFKDLAYDGELSEPHPGGISHVAFMVDNLDDFIADLELKGLMPFRGPYVADIGDLGKRKVVFYKSPNGTILEPQQLL